MPMVVQPTMQVYDDLAAAFSRNMTLQSIEKPVEQQQQQQQPQPAEEEPKIVYISQHYTHSAHIARPGQEQSQPIQRPSSEPPQVERELVETVLRNHGVDPSGLSASQLQLFKTAEEAQQLRLLELWRICPPSNGSDNPALAWSSTTVEQEEQLAKMRYERQQEAAQQQQQQQQEVMSLDGTPLTPIQAGDGRWVQMHHYMEPYMETGYSGTAYEEIARREYEESARRAYEETLSRPKDVYSTFGTAVGGPTYKPATDPVYQTANADADWQRQQMMENQYGAFEQFRHDDDEML